jgi:hypothetical protein
VILKVEKKKMTRYGDEEGRIMLSDGKDIPSSPPQPLILF